MINAKAGKDLDVRMYDRGVETWHSSDGCGPDVGISAGIGGAMIYAGEVPGMTGGWSLAVYSEDGGRDDIAATVDVEAARSMIERIAVLLRATP